MTLLCDWIKSIFIKQFGSFSASNLTEDLDWIEQGLTSPPTQYRLSGRQVKRPNQQHQSTEDKITFCFYPKSVVSFLFQLTRLGWQTPGLNHLPFISHLLSPLISSQIAQIIIMHRTGATTRCPHNARFRACESKVTGGRCNIPRLRSRRVCKSNVTWGSV